MREGKGFHEKDVVQYLTAVDDHICVIRLWHARRRRGLLWLCRRKEAGDFMFVIPYEDLNAKASADAELK